MDGPATNKPVPRKPMVELQAGSNVWYQGNILKESANEVKIKYAVPSKSKRQGGGGHGGRGRRRPVGG